MAENFPLKRVENIALGEISASYSVWETGVTERGLEAVKIQADASIAVSKNQADALVVPAKHLTYRHTISAAIVFVGLAALIREPAVGGWIVLIVAIMNAPSIVEQVKKVLGK